MSFLSLLTPVRAIVGVAALATTTIGGSMAYAAIAEDPPAPAPTPVTAVAAATPAVDLPYKGVHHDPNIRIPLAGGTYAEPIISTTKFTLGQDGLPGGVTIKGVAVPMQITADLTANVTVKIYESPVHNANIRGTVALTGLPVAQWTLTNIPLPLPPPPPPEPEPDRRMFWYNLDSPTPIALGPGRKTVVMTWTYLTGANEASALGASILSGSKGHGQPPDDIYSMAGPCTGQSPTGVANCTINATGAAPEGWGNDLKVTWLV